MFKVSSHIKFVLPALFSCMVSFGQCIFLGPNSSSNIGNNTTTGSINWSGLSNVASDNNSYASCGTLLGILSTINTHFLNTSDFGFSIPSTATVCGIEVIVEKHASGLIIGSSIKDNNVSIIKGGSITGTNHASSASWTGSDVSVTYGSSTDNWGTTWTPADINAGNFGVAFSAKLASGLAGLFLTANIDKVAIQVYYTTKVLEIKLVSFTGKINDNRVRLNWETSMEKNAASFEVEKMNSNSEWNVIATLPGSGNSNVMQSYQVFDEDVLEMNYYRLKQLDHNQTISYSQVISVEYNALKEQELILYPIPVADLLHIKVQGKVEHVEVISDAGDVSIPELLSNEDTMIDISSLAKGLYVIKVYTAKQALIRKFDK